MGKNGRRLVIFDLGGVMLLDFNCIQYIADKYGLGYEEVFEDYMHYDVPLMEGYMDVSGYYDHFSRHFGIKAGDNDFIEGFTYRLNDTLFALVAELRKAGHRCVVGSNTFAPHWDLLLKRGLADHFDALYASHLIQASKPDLLFHRIILEQEGFAAEDSFFLDDREENIAAAASLGITAIRYTPGCDLSVLEQLCRC